MIGGASAGAGRQAEDGAETAPPQRNQNRTSEQTLQSAAEMKNSFGRGKNDTNTMASLSGQISAVTSAGIKSQISLK